MCHRSLVKVAAQVNPVVRLSLVTDRRGIVAVNPCSEGREKPGGLTHKCERQRGVCLSANASMKSAPDFPTDA